MQGSVLGQDALNFSIKSNSISKLLCPSLEVSSKALVYIMQLSEDSKERIAKILDISRVAIHYGYIPLILYMGYTRSAPRPSLISLLSPLG
ncbi:Tom7-domain-containing protein [Microthyrium microscopicum]|uniref:Tom7-domain-containing protein n=1 Tax=Microthyrium microscopicum TaxID=703497 RepID=A0A6A6U466_9PEZI|nr:Tom7-domain-containing protein [Microthyrium microscopicum]